MKKKLVPLYSFLASTGVSLLAYFIKIIPCKTTQIVTVDSQPYLKTFCNLSQPAIENSTLFFYLTQYSIIAFIINIILWFMIFMVIFSLIRKYKKSKPRRR